MDKKKKINAGGTIPQWADMTQEKLVRIHWILGIGGLN